MGRAARGDADGVASAARCGRGHPPHRTWWPPRLAASVHFM